MRGKQGELFAIAKIAALLAVVLAYDFSGFPRKKRLERPFCGYLA